MPSGKIITPDALFVRHRYARNELDVSCPTLSTEGYFKMVVRRADGSVRQETPWFKNLILNAGLDRWMGNGQIATNSLYTSFKVGTNSTPPAANQSTLFAQVATSNDAASAGHTLVFSSAAPWWVGYRVSGRFGAGQLSGQALTEIGFGWDDTACFSRALITPDGTNAGSITVQADESLDVYYEWRVYPNANDATGAIVLNGTTHNFVLRPAHLNSAGGFGFAQSVASGFWISTFGGLASYPDEAWGSGSLGVVTDGASGAEYTNTFPASPPVQPYTNGTYQRTHSRLYGLNELNTPSGDIQVMQIYTARVGTYQMSFAPKIPKGPTRTLRLDFSTTLARRP